MTFFSNTPVAERPVVAKGDQKLQASTPKELFAGNVTGQREQICNRVLIGALLAEPLGLIFGGSEKYDRGDIIDLVCKPHPLHPEQLIVALFHDLANPPKESEEEKKGFVMAIIDLERKVLLRSYHETIDQDAVTRIGEFSLWIDTARYNLAPGVRALGIRMNIGHSPNCASGGESGYLTLFVEQGKELRPVLHHFPTTSWQITEGEPCSPNDTSLVIDEQKLTLSVAATSTKGWRDLEIHEHQEIETTDLAKEQTNTLRPPPQLVGKLRMRNGVYVHGRRKKSSM